MKLIGILILILCLTYYIGTPRLQNHVAEAEKNNVMSAYAKLPILSATGKCNTEEYKEPLYFLGGPPLEWTGYSRSANINCFFTPSNTVESTLDTYEDMVTKKDWQRGSERKKEFNDCVSDYYEIPDPRNMRGQTNYRLWITTCDLTVYKATGDILIQLSFVPSTEDQQDMQRYAVVTYATVFGVLFILLVVPYLIFQRRKTGTSR